MIRKKVLGIAAGSALLFLGVCAAGFSFFSVEFRNPNFHYVMGQATFNGKPFTGISYEFYPDRSPYKLQFFWNGKQEWTEHRWYGTGAVWQEIQYLHGQRHGELRIWYPTGKVQYLKHYQHDVAHGEFWGWHPNGVVSDYHVFENGKQRVYKSFISDGHPYFNYVYRDGQPVGVQGGEYCKTQKTF